MADELVSFEQRPSGLSWTGSGFELHVRGTLPGPRAFSVAVAFSSLAAALGNVIAWVVGDMPEAGLAPVLFLVGFAFVSAWWGRGRRVLVLRGGPAGLQIRHRQRLLVDLPLSEVQAISQEHGWIRVRGPRGIVWLDARDHAGLELTQALSQLQDERVRQLMGRDDPESRQALEDLLSTMG